MAGEPLPGQQLWEREIVPVVLPKAIALPSHQHPYLVQLRGPDDPLLELSLDLAEGERTASQSGGLDGEGRAAHRIGGWLQSSMQPEALADIVATMCLLKTDAYTKAAYLRLADRRVLDLLCHVVGCNRVASQFGRLQSWDYLDPAGRLRRLRSSDEQAGPLRLSAAEWQRLARGELLHRTLAQWLGAIAQMDGVPPEALYVATENAVTNAASAAKTWPHRFKTSGDETVWAALSLLHPSLPHSHAVLKLLADPGSEAEPPEPLRYLHHDVSAIAEQAGSVLTR
ncbi:hypothetical protein RugamoR64_28420 [Duganella rhizosphaerae]